MRFKWFFQICHKILLQATRASPSSRPPRSVCLLACDIENFNRKRARNCSLFSWVQRTKLHSFPTGLPTQFLQDLPVGKAFRRCLNWSPSCSSPNRWSPSLCWIRLRVETRPHGHHCHSIAGQLQSLECSFLKPSNRHTGPQIKPTWADCSGLSIETTGP